VPLPAERLQSFIDRTKVVGDCLEWTGAKHPLGYGRLKLNGDLKQAHRIAYELWMGPIPPHLELDHLCRNPSCVNPGHLEPVSHAENLRRIPARTHCLKGHEFTPENTGVHVRGKRYCLACKSERDRQYNQGRRKCAT
jgi:hypothetical protein